MRLAACFLVSAALLLVSAVAEPVKSQPPGGKNTFGKQADAGKLFELLAKGKDALDLATVPPFVRTPLEEFVKANKLDPAKITRAQFQAFMDARAGGAKGPDRIDAASAQKSRGQDVNGDGQLNQPVAVSEE